MLLYPNIHTGEINVPSTNLLKAVSKISWDWTGRNLCFLECCDSKFLKYVLLIKMEIYFTPSSPLSQIRTSRAGSAFENRSQLCLSFCDLMGCSPSGSSVHGLSQARLLEWVDISSSWGIFPTQGSNSGLLHCSQILYQLSHKGSPRILEWVHLHYHAYM